MAATVLAALVWVIQVRGASAGTSTRTSGGTATTLLSGPETASGSPRQFRLQIDGSSPWLFDGPVGSTPTLRVGPLAHGLGRSTANIYLHAHNDSAATSFVVDDDAVLAQ